MLNREMSDEIDAILSDLEGLGPAPVTARFTPHPPARSNVNQVVNPKLKYIRPEYSTHVEGSNSPILENKLTIITRDNDEEEDQLLSSFSPSSLNMILQTQSPKNDNTSLIKNTKKVDYGGNNENDNISNSSDSNSIDQLLEQLKSPTIALNDAITTTCPITATANDFDNDDDIYNPAAKSTVPLVNHLSLVDNNDKQKTARCIRVIIGGSNVARGLKSSSFSKVVCNNLRCLQCNFIVLAFTDRVWTYSVDYMFFRNNFPTEKLESELMESQSGHVAYCCQCSWIAVNEEKEIISNNNTESIKWICSGH